VRAGHRWKRDSFAWAALEHNGGGVVSGSDLTIIPPGNYSSDPASSLPPYVEVVWVVRVK